jgi:hypothetical protein
MAASVHSAQQAAVDERRSSPLPVLRGRYELHPHEVLADLSTPSTAAYGVTDTFGRERSLFAVMCASDLPCRGHAMSRIRQAAPAGVLPIVDRGVVDWPPSGQRCLAVIYPRPAGGSLEDCLNRRIPIASEHDIPRRIMAPIVKGLRGLDAIAVPHRSIRPGNVHFLDEAKRDLVLGDCVTVPPAFDQPAMFETIERAMASPAGRGEGALADDLYAFGVVLALVSLGRNPVAHLSEDEYLALRIARGTYSVLCERERIPLSLIDPLRGLLSDDAAMRWGLDDLEAWLKGQRVMLPRKAVAAKPAAAFCFAGAYYEDLRALAHALSERPGEAASAIRSGEVEQWLARKRGSTDLARAVADVVASVNNRRGWLASDDVLVAQIGNLLDPQAPVRYRDIRVMADGLGPALAVSWLRKGERQTPAEIITLISGGFFRAADSASSHGSCLHEPLRSRLRVAIERPGTGFGLERCLYDLNVSMPCRSPAVQSAHVLDVEGLLMALETAAGNSDRSSLPMDRHIAAFVGARSEDSVDGPLQAMSAGEGKGSALETLRLLATIHRRLNVAPLPGVAMWIGAQLGPAVATYRNRDIRNQIEQALDRASAAGNLSDMVDLVENPERRRTDSLGFTRATRDYRLIATRIAALERTGPMQVAADMAAGRRVAATTALLVSTFAIGLATLSYLT